MNINRESDNPTEITLNISMDPADEEPYLNRSYRRLASRVRIPGFRPGKAPRSVVERHLGRPALIQEALEFMIPESLDQILRQQQIRAFIDPQVEVTATDPVSFKATIPLEPQVELGEYTAIRLQTPPIQIGTDEINRVLQRLQYENAPWQPANRPAAFGDLLTLNVHGTINGQEAINSQGIDYIPNLENRHPLPGFSVHLEGMTEGQEKTFTLPVPPESTPDTTPNQECRFQVTILAIKEKRLPQLDDEFAKGVQDGFETLTDLTQHIHRRLTQEAETNALRQLEHNSIQEIKKIATIQASELIYQREIETLRQDHQTALRSQNLDMETYLRLTGQTHQQWQTQLRPQAEDRLATHLILRKLAQQENLQIQPQEIETEIQRLIQTTDQTTTPNIQQILNSPDSRESIRANLLNTKVMARLIQIVQGQPDTPDDAAPDDAAPDTPADTDTISEAPEPETVANITDDAPDAPAETPDTEPETVAEAPETVANITDDAPDAPADPETDTPESPQTGESPNA